MEYSLCRAVTGWTACARRIVYTPGLRQPEMLDLSRSDQILDRAGDVLDRHVRIDAVLVEQVDAIGPQALQRGVGHFSDVLRSTVQDLLLAVVAEGEAEFRGDDDLLPERLQGFADQLFVGERTIDFSRVEKGDAALDSRADQRDAGLLVDGRSHPPWIRLFRRHTQMPSHSVRVFSSNDLSMRWSEYSAPSGQRLGAIISMSILAGLMNGPRKLQRSGCIRDCRERAQFHQGCGKAAGFTIGPQPNHSCA
jgi:hypothetical protein